MQPRKEPNFSDRLLREVYPLFRLLFPNRPRSFNRCDPRGLLVVIRVLLLEHRNAALAATGINSYGARCREHASQLPQKRSCQRKNAH